MSKRSYMTPQLKVHGTIKELTHGIKQLGTPSDSLYVGDKENPITGSCTPSVR